MKKKLIVVEVEAVVARQLEVRKRRTGVPTAVYIRKLIEKDQKRGKIYCD